MKKLKLQFSYALTIFALLLIGLKAEADTASGWSVAPSLGYNYFKLSGDLDLESKSSTSGGIMVYKNLDTNLELQSGLVYVEAGGKQNYNSGIFSFTVAEMNLQYLVIPIGAKWTFLHYGDGATSTVYLQGGANVAYLMAAKYKRYLGDVGESDIKSEMRSFDLQAYVGVGGSKEVSKNQSVTYDLNYIKGLQSVSKEGDNKISGYSLNLGYNISI